MQSNEDSQERYFVFIAAVLAFIAVLAGAYAQHGLEGTVTPERLAVFKMAAQYQMYHALALLAAAYLWARWRSRLVAAAGWLFVASTILFSGSLYALVLTDSSWMGVVTPIGGTGLQLAWLMLAIAALYSQRRGLGKERPSDEANPGHRASG